MSEVDSCSAKGCTAPAVHALLWRNPKIHTPERRKAWLAYLDQLRGLIGESGNS